MILGERSHHKPILKRNPIKVETRDNVFTARNEKKTDKKLTFKQHIKNLCGKVQCKPRALRSIRAFLTIETGKIFGNEFKDSQFNYAQLL